jgi:hypothetical protein
MIRQRCRAGARSTVCTVSDPAKLPVEHKSRKFTSEPVPFSTHATTIMPRGGICDPSALRKYLVVIFTAYQGMHLSLAHEGMFREPFLFQMGP